MAKTITAAVVAEPKADFVIEEVELSDPLAGEVVVEVQAVGICHTDLSCRDGLLPSPHPTVFGHEGAGVVESVGPGVTELAPGDRVALSYNSCGFCPNCLIGKPFYCHNLAPLNFGASRLDGTTALTGSSGEQLHSHFFGQSSFATHAVVPVRAATKIESEIPVELLAPFGCGLQTGAGAVLNVLHPRPRSSFAVFGLGGVGMGAVMAAAASSVGTIIGVDLNPDRLALAEQLGATHSVNAADGDVAERLIEMTGGGVDFAVEVSGATAAFRASVDCLAPAGSVGLMGGPPWGTEVALDVNGIFSTGKRIVGIVEGESIPQLFIPELVSLWERGKFPVERLVETFSFEQINEASAKAHDGSVVKPVLKL